MPHNKRVRLFPPATLQRIKRRLDRRSGTSVDWPALEGCLAILFSSRSGSTYLAQKITERFAPPLIQEALNAPRVKRHMEIYKTSGYADGLAAFVAQNTRDGWFGFKAGTPGIISGETLGFFDRYIGVTGFIYLVRRDLMMQSISLTKANVTRQFHSTQKIEVEANADDFDADAILHNAGLIVKACAQTKTYINQADRPCAALAYEDFEHGDMDKVDAACRKLGVPELEEQESNVYVEMLDRTLNEVWKERLIAERRDEVAALVAHYEDTVLSNCRF